MTLQAGRPTIITADTVHKLEQAFREGLNVSQACFTSGVGRTAYYDHLNNNEEFANKMWLAQQYITVKAKQLVTQEIQDGNLAAAKWWLERKAKEEFGPNATNDNDFPQPQNDEDDLLKQSITEMRRLVDVAIMQAEAQEASEAQAKREAKSDSLLLNHC